MLGASRSNFIDPLDYSSHSVRSQLSVRNAPASLEGFGEALFSGLTAAPYLKQVGLPANTLDSPDWTTNGSADKVRAIQRYLHCQGHVTSLSSR